MINVVFQYLIYASIFQRVQNSGGSVLPEQESYMHLAVNVYFGLGIILAVFEINIIPAFELYVKAIFCNAYSAL